MNAVFADTSFYIAAANPLDRFYAQAVSQSRTIHGHVVTTEYVLLELGSYFSRAMNREVFIDLLPKIEQDARTQIVWASHQLFHEGVELFSRRADKDWSLTDCISFVVMQKQSLTEALTCDHHFEQAGFRALLGNS